ncbi:uncharacterized protein FFNC_00892 [Fusarium fujikuroi]|nr:uncharacterized protein FFNC_00892 [Fusarium fujikuroi]
MVTTEISGEISTIVTKEIIP